MASRRLFWAAVWLGFALIIIKASHLGPPPIGDVAGYLRSLAAISYRDVLFVALAPPAGARRARTGLVLWTAIALWTGLGQYVYATDWARHYDWRIAENPPWVLVSSLWQAVSGGPTARLSAAFPDADLADFAPIGSRPPAAAASRRPPNVVLIVLESVAARWTGVSGGAYDSTPTLKAEAAHGIVFDRVYAHIGRSSNSLASMLLSVYPKLDFLDY